MANTQLKMVNPFITRSDKTREKYNVFDLGEKHLKKNKIQQAVAAAACIFSGTDLNRCLAGLHHTETTRSFTVLSRLHMAGSKIKQLKQRTKSNIYSVSRRRCKRFVSLPRRLHNKIMSLFRGTKKFFVPDAFCYCKGCLKGEIITGLFDKSHACGLGNGTINSIDYRCFPEIVWQISPYSEGLV